MSQVSLSTVKRATKGGPVDSATVKALASALNELENEPVNWKDLVDWSSDRGNAPRRGYIVLSLPEHVQQMLDAFKPNTTAEW